MAKVLRQTTVIRDGMHNAFTDLQFWQGAYWVGYRKGVLDYPTGSDVPCDVYFAELEL